MPYKVAVYAGEPKETLRAGASHSDSVERFALVILLLLLVP